jgi:hypothetical protein
MTPEQIEEVIERTAVRTADRLEEKFRGMLSALGFNMDPDKLYEEQQMIAFARTMHQGTRTGLRAIVGAFCTAAVGGLVWLFTNRPHP